MAVTLEPVLVDVKPPKAHKAPPIIHSASPELPPKPHHQPALHRLPLELRQQIYRLALTTPEPFVDPCVPSTSGPTIKSPYHHIPSTGLNLLLTCRQIHSEATALGCLYRENIFQFTTVTHCHKFLALLGPERAAQIQIISINLRLVAQKDAVVAAEWLSYTSENARDGLWTQRRLGSLRTDLPNLRCVRLDLVAWCRPGFGQHRWEYFRSLLKELRGLDCVAVGGEVKMRNLDLASAEPWAPELFLTNDVVDRSKVVPYGGTMADLIVPALHRPDEKDCEKRNGLEVRWRIANGEVMLELSTKSRCARKLSAINPCYRKDPWTDAYRHCRGELNSSCTWMEYEKQVNTFRSGPCPFPLSLPQTSLWV
ncbi:MAG: hypothetical protein M1821_007794 [Bathelium mastoideum]|nr:MAG: hypothetical protein M1821_007794 [Bathelium mastoideum]